MKVYATLMVSEGAVRSAHNGLPTFSQASVYLSKEPIEELPPGWAEVRPSEARGILEAATADEPRPSRDVRAGPSEAKAKS